MQMPLFTIRLLSRTSLSYRPLIARLCYLRRTTLSPHPSLMPSTLPFIFLFLPAMLSFLPSLTALPLPDCTSISTACRFNFNFLQYILCSLSSLFSTRIFSLKTKRSYTIPLIPSEKHLSFQYKLFTHISSSSMRLLSPTKVTTSPNFTLASSTRSSYSLLYHFTSIKHFITTSAAFSSLTSRVHIFKTHSILPSTLRILQQILSSPSRTSFSSLS